MVEFVWTPVAIPGILALVASVAMAIAIYAAAPQRAQNRFLALFLVVEATSFASLLAVWPLVASDAEAWSLRGVEFSFQISAGLLYLAFVGTIDSPLSRPFRSAIARRILLAGVAATFLAWPLLSPLILGDALVADYHGKLMREGRPLAGWTDVGYGVILLYGLVVALDAWRRTTPGTAAHSQARAYGIAFGLRDLVLGTRLLLILWRLLPLPPWTPGPLTEGYSFFSFSAGHLAGLALLGYGTLKTQLFDIDLKIKWGIRRGTLVGAFLAVFIIVAAVVEQWLQQYGVLLGGVAVGLMLLALRPIERAADRLADRAMPNVQDTHEYRTVRKREVYRAAVESALVDGGDISPKERGMLATLAEQLGVGPKEMHDIEREARAARAV